MDWTGTGRKLSMVFVLSIALAGAMASVYNPWTSIALLNTGPEEIYEYAPDICFAGNQLWLAYNEADDRTGSWIWSLKYRILNEDLSIIGEDFILPPGVNADSPSVATDGVNIWVVYVYHGEAGDQLCYSYWEPDSGWLGNVPITTAAGLNAAYQPCIAYIPDRGELWLAYVGETETRKGRQKASGLVTRDIYLKRGTVDDTVLNWAQDSDLKLTSCGDEWEPSIASLGNTVLMAWSSRRSGEYTVRSATITERGLAQEKEVTHFWGRDPELVEIAGQVWVFYEPYWFGMVGKYLGSDGWSEPIWVADDIEQVRNAAPALAGNDLYLFVEGSNPGMRSRIGYTYARAFSLPGYETEAEVVVDSAEHQSARNRLIVQARCSNSALSLKVYGWVSADDWTCIGQMVNNGDGTYGFDGPSDYYRYVKASTTGANPGFYIRRCPAVKGNQGK